MPRCGVGLGQWGREERGDGGEVAEGGEGEDGDGGEEAVEWVAEGMRRGECEIDGEGWS